MGVVAGSGGGSSSSSGSRTSTSSSCRLRSSIYSSSSIAYRCRSCLLRTPTNTRIPGP